MSITAFKEGAPGIYHGIPQADYRAHPAVSHSQLRKLRRTAAHYQHEISQPPEPSKPEQLIGTFTHHLLLEPEREFPGIAIKPKGMSFSTTEGKQWKQAQGTKTIVGEEDWKAIRDMALAVAAHPVFQQIEESAQWEVSLLCARHAFDGEILCKARVDIVPISDALADIKTTQDADDYPFSKAIYDYGYHSQAAWYLDLWNALHPNDQRHDFIIFAVEKAPPHLVAGYRIHPESIEAGRTLNYRRLETLVSCQKTDTWPGYAPGLLEISIPQWAWKRDQGIEMLLEDPF